MQIIGNGLIVPVPITVEEWERRASKEMKSALRNWRNKMKNLEARIAKLEVKHSDPLIDAFHESACYFAREQGRPEPERLGDIVQTMKQWADYLPD